ncbi:MAG: hypothetical protein ACYS3N_02480 [Planctomycetota bacterium]
MSIVLYEAVRIRKEVVNNKALEHNVTIDAHSGRPIPQPKS